LLNHDANQIFGRTTAGTLRIGTDQKGLWYECDLPDTEAGRSLMESISRGDVTQSSFQFSIAKGGSEWTEQELGAGAVKTTRTIKKMGRLFDVAPVTFPAYSQTDVSKRSYEAWKEQQTTEQDQQQTQEPDPLWATKKRLELRKRTS
jgi:HK97 family phage prohead protease